MGWFCQVVRINLCSAAMTSAVNRGRSAILTGFLCAVPGLLVFQFLGNSTHGYIDTSSLYYWWGYQWLNPASETQHGWLVLAISVWLAGRNLAAERAASHAPRETLGVPAAAMAGGLALHALGYLSEQARVSVLGLLLFLWGLAGMLGGTRWSRACAFPLGYMVFAMPLNVLDSLGFWLRMAVIHSTAILSHGVGLGVIANGTQLVSPDGSFEYDVAAACSGVRSMVALAALSLLVGYLGLRSSRRRALVLLSSVPLIFVGNLLRIFSVVLAAHVWGQKWGERVHDVMGYAVFGVVLAGAYGFAGLLARSEAPAAQADAPEAKAAGAFSPGGSDGIGAGAARLAVLGASLACACVLFLASRTAATEGAGVVLSADGRDPAALPAFVGSDWMGRATEVTRVEREILPPDTGFSRRTYFLLSDPSKQVLLSLVLSGSDRTSIHRPELCLVGQGWTIDDSFSHRFTYPGVGTFPATVLRTSRQVRIHGATRTVKSLFAYYFVSGDAVVATHWSRVSRDALNRIFHRKADRWAYIALQTQSDDGEEDALGRMQAILDGTLGAFQRRDLSLGR